MLHTTELSNTTTWDQLKPIEMFLKSYNQYDIYENQIILYIINLKNLFLYFNLM